MWLVAPGLAQKRSEHTGVAFVGGSAQTCCPAVPPKAVEIWDLPQLWSEAASADMVHLPDPARHPPGSPRIWTTSGRLGFGCRRGGA